MNTIHIAAMTSFVGGIVMLGFFSDVRRRLVHSERMDIRAISKFVIAKMNASPMMEKYMSERTGREIYEGLSLLRNIISTPSDFALNADYVVLRLSQKKGVLKETYCRMLSLIHTNRMAEAEKCLAEKCRCPMGREYASLLAGWDTTEPEDIKEIIFSYQKTIREINLTEQKKKEETLSDIIYLPAVANIFVIFINFVYTGYFSEQKELLNMLM